MELVCLHLFCAYISDSCSGKEDTQRQPFGVYLQAFCSGLNDVLVPYRKDIVDLEAGSLTDPYLPLLTVLSKVEEYTKLFEVLNYMIKQVSQFCIMSAYISWPLLSCAS
jgi:gamma-tubulin complex component 4